MAYATVSDLENRWRVLTTEEEAKASALVDDASAFLDVQIEKYRIDAEAKAAVLKSLCCDLVQRRMESQEANTSLSALTQTAGAFSETLSFSTKRRKSWELYKEDLEMLGVVKGGFTMIPVAIHRPWSGDEIEW